MLKVKIKNELEAVELSLEIWEFLKETGKLKEHFNLHLASMYLASCPLCQFHIDQNPKNQKSNKEYPSGCEECCLFSKRLCRFSADHSAFFEWTKTDNSEAKKYHASVIYDALMKRLNELKGGR